MNRRVPRLAAPLVLGLVLLAASRAAEAQQPLPELSLEELMSWTPAGCSAPPSGSSR